MSYLLADIQGETSILKRAFFQYRDEIHSSPAFLEKRQSCCFRLTFAGRWQLAEDKLKPKQGLS